MADAENKTRAPFRGAYVGKRVLVTGHTGFKGAWLCEWLLSLGADVTGLALPPPTKPALFDQLGLAPRLSHLLGDIRDLATVERAIEACRPDFVFHLAAQSLVRPSYEQPVETYATNVLGTVHVLEAVRRAGRPCVVVAVTTDKCYENREDGSAYREEEPMGGHDPYSSSKGAAELVIAAYRRSFFSPPPSALSSQAAVRLASVRAGNVIGGGDWALDRIVPDCIRALQRGEAIPVRNKVATRPWQHVLEPLSGYLWLAAVLADPQVSGLFASVSRSENRGQSPQRRLVDDPRDASTHQQGTPAGQQAGTANSQLTSAFNFGPDLDSNRTVAELVQEVLKHWPGRWEDRSDPAAVHEAKQLNLSTEKAGRLLQWRPALDFAATIRQTVDWYRQVSVDPSLAAQLARAQIADYEAAARATGITWAGKAENPGKIDQSI